MAEFAHDSTLGSWFFQATPTAAVLDRMTKNTRAAHWNKPRATRYRVSADIGTTQTEDTEDTHQLLLSGVRVIRGPQTVDLSDGRYDVHETVWVGNPQVMFPQGQGLTPFVRRPVPISMIVGMKIVKTSPADGVYDFLNWFGGLEWGAASATSPEGVEYDVEQLFTNEDWVRCSVARPIPYSHSNQPGASDLTIGLRFRIIFGRLGGTFTVPTVFLLGGRAGGYYIHYHVMGPVAAY
jgi:hypothetical protein